MIINLALDPTVPFADEAKRSLTRFMGQLSSAQQKTSHTLLTDDFKICLGHAVEKFNNKILDKNSFKHSLYQIYVNIKG